MALFTIADLHLPLGIDKPMDVFGSSWKNYVNRIHDNWQKKIKPDDVIVIPGDFSWATYLNQAYKDFEFLHNLNGKKYIAKGNHDYWWSTMRKMREYLLQNGWEDIDFLQNNCIMYKNTALCATRGWIHPSWESFSESDVKYFNREVMRLELALNEAVKNNPDKIYVFTHYPPMGFEAVGNAFTDTLEKYGVERCYYGHLHAESHRNALNGTVNGVRYSLVSADYIRFDPVLVDG